MDVLDQYVPDPGPLRRPCPTAAAGAAGSCCRSCRSGCGRTSATTSRSRRSGRSCGGPSTSASPISTWPTTTARRYGSAEINFGRLLREDLRPYRDELVISTKAGYDMWPGPLRRPRLAQVPAGQPGPEPAPDGARLRRHLLLPPVRPGHPARGDDGGTATRGPAGQGAATRASRRTRPTRTARGGRDPRAMGTPLLIHQPSYSMLNRWVEGGLLDGSGARAPAASSSPRSRRGC